MTESQTPMSKGCVQSAFRAALKQSGINKKVSVHTLRHSYVTMMLENGTNLRLIQTYLGYSSPNTTSGPFSNVGIADQQIEAQNFYGQAITLWLSHKNGPHRFVC